MHSCHNYLLTFSQFFIYTACFRAWCCCCNIFFSVLFITIHYVSLHIAFACQSKLLYLASSSISASSLIFCYAGVTWPRRSLVVNSLKLLLQSLHFFFLSRYCTAPPSALLTISPCGTLLINSLFAAHPSSFVVLFCFCVLLLLTAPAFPKRFYHFHFCAFLPT